MWTNLSRRSFVAMAAGAASWPSFATAAQQQRPLDVRQFGARGDGVHDDTAAFAAALGATDQLYVSAGIYLVDKVLIPAGRTILTDGFATTFRQRRGMPKATRLLMVNGSQVRIGSCTLEGNIASDEGEEHHGILVNATDEVGDLEDISIGHVAGRNLRGDVVYIGSLNRRTVRNVRVGRVTGDNILRNVVSIVGGRKIAIEQISGSRVGLTHLDIEPEEYSGPVIDCVVGAVQGTFVQVAGSSPESFIERTRIGLLDLAGPKSGSSPPYGFGLDRIDALTLRNVRSLEIARLIARNFHGSALRQVFEPGELTRQSVHIGEADLRDCAADASRQALIMGSPRATHLRIDRLNVGGVRPGVDVVRDCKEVVIGTVRGVLPPGSRLIGNPDSPLAMPALPASELLYAATGGAITYGGYRLARRLRGR